MSTQATGGRLLFKCWAFSDSTPARFCTFCEVRPATRACDAPVTRNGRTATCDSALCAECSLRSGRKDLCPEHRT